MRPVSAPRPGIPNSPKAALKSAKAGMARDKANPNWPNMAGLALSQMGRHREAAEMYRKAIKLAPEFDDARRNLGQALILQGRHDTARKLLEGLTRTSKGDGAAWYLLAQCYLALGALIAAETAATRAIEATPKQARGFNLRALIRDRSGKTAGSLADFEAALAVNPNDVETLVNISLPLSRLLRRDEALNAVRRAVELAPAHVGARLRLAMHMIEGGQTDAAISALLDLLALAPDHAGAIEQLAGLQDKQANRDLEAIAKRALKSAPRKSEARASLHFALAQIAEQAEDRGAARTERAAANHEMARLMPYDAKADTALTEKLLSRFSDPITTRGTPLGQPTPIFVLGLPRSGTTLAEAILGAHPAVAPLGERIAAGVLLQGVINTDQPFDTEAIAAFRDGDAALLPDLPVGTVAWVDKMPENYRLIGFLKTAYPWCRIINLTRDPRDVALSMWRGHFSGSALNYTYDLTAMSHRFNLYAKSMAHWRALLPEQILDLSYEETVMDVETASRKLAAFCGLDWHENMASPQDHVAQVLTMSATQLRQPVHNRSVGRWREYADELKPFIDGLDRALWPGLEA